MKQWGLFQPARQILPTKLQLAPPNLFTKIETRKLPKTCRLTKPDYDAKLMILIGVKLFF